MGFIHGKCFLKKDITITGIQFRAEDGRPGDLTAFLPDQQIFAVIMWLAEGQKSKLTSLPWVVFDNFMIFHEYFQIIDCTTEVSEQYNELLAKNGLPTIDWQTDQELSDEKSS